MSLMETLIYCLGILKIGKGSEIYRNALELQRVLTKSVDGSNGWIGAMKIIAHVNSFNIFTKSQLADFLTLSTKGIEEKRRSSEVINNLIYRIYMDIIENYESFSDSLRSKYPGIIVDVISIINRGMDTKGFKVSDIWKYYQSRKQQAATMVEEEGREKILSYSPAPTSTTSTTVAAAAATHKEKIILLSKKDLVRRLSQITDRDRKELEGSLSRLQDSDLKKISELCGNYSKLQYYSRLIAKEDSQEKFRNEIQRELGRELSPQQIGRAISSIRRVRIYIENILDNKFIPDSSHGINHIKHNIEYGYQMMNLIGPSRKKKPSTNEIGRPSGHA